MKSDFNQEIKGESPYPFVLAFLYNTLLRNSFLLIIHPIVKVGIKSRPGDISSKKLNIAPKRANLLFLNNKKNAMPAMGAQPISKNSPNPGTK